MRVFWVEKQLSNKAARVRERIQADRDRSGWTLYPCGLNYKQEIPIPTYTEDGSSNKSVNSSLVFFNSSDRI